MSTATTRGDRQLSVSGRNGKRYGNGNGNGNGNSTGNSNSNGNGNGNSNSNGNLNSNANGVSASDPPLGRGTASRSSIGGGGTRNAWSKPLQPVSSNSSGTGNANLNSVGTVTSSFSSPSLSSLAAGTTSSIGGSSSADTVIGAGDPEKHMNDRLTFLLAKSVGATAIVTVASGLRYKGILGGALTDTDLGIMLRFAERTTSVPGIDEDSSKDGDEDDSNGKPKRFDKLVITPKDCVDIYIENPDMTVDKPKSSDTSSPGNTSSTVTTSAGGIGTFKTDTDISGKKGATFERELQRWTPDPSEDLSNMTLEDSASLAIDKADGWDQFSVNQQKFGVESTYDEHYYTTAIDKSHPEYQERARRAERIAAEITGSSHGGNVHLAEERGLVVDDSGLDEEDKYSGVDRRPQKQQQQQQQKSSRSQHQQYQQVSSSNLPSGSSNRQSVGGGMVQILQSQQPPLSATTSAAVNAGGAKKYTPPQFRAPSGVKGLPGVPYDPAIISSSLVTPDGRLTPKTNETNKLVASDNNDNDKVVSDGSITTGTTSGIEKELVANFSQFVSVEYQRLNQKKQYLQKKEKSDRLHDFKKFSEGYKINAPVPADLVPILAKGKDKQEEIVQRAAANAAAASTPKTSPSLTKAHADKSSTVSPAPSTPAVPVAVPSSAVSIGPGTVPTSVSTIPLEPSSSTSYAAKKQQPSEVKLPTSIITATNTATAAKQPEAKATISSSSTSTNSSTTSVVSGAASVPVAALPKFNFKVPGFRPNPSAHSFTPLVGSKTSPSPLSSQVASPQAKPTPTVSTTTRSPSVPSFFGNKVVGAKSRDGKFNPFLRAKAGHIAESPFIIERAFATPPTWVAGVEKSYTEVLDALEVSGSPRVYYGSGSDGISPRPSVGGFPPSSPMALSGANLVPMMPATAFDELGNPIIATSPPPIPGQMMPGMIPAMGYPQYMVPQQYGAAQFYRSPQPMGFPLGYLPPQGGYASPRIHQAVMVPTGQPGNGYYPPQPQFMQRGSMNSPSSHGSHYNSYSRRGSNGPNGPNHGPPPPHQNHGPPPPPPPPPPGSLNSQDTTAPEEKK